MSSDLAGALWFKSSRSHGSGECVEVAYLAGGRVGVRDSKDSAGPPLVFAPGEWDAFVTGVQTGEFDTGMSLT
ncbi:DUF397 domain-containing protein [Nocardia otitidiscaviarum]|uniref:DUF397 domain-containing protein n=1 Tax=Nocardia otitidiscaviarum TaxID=1823 RepID=A0A516NR72_9NOCA|nr:DUF397 domain-containing protein [Nocardia otitidiscaviarum]MCP9625318.1 DUF397 domain-containing protein [Nocardia otitidiscaviarum]QDP81405.1 DUF397 domain-containing protein [Nocardia otitidiscaviarum]